MKHPIAHTPNHIQYSNERMECNLMYMDIQVSKIGNGTQGGVYWYTQGGVYWDILGGVYWELEYSFIYMDIKFYFWLRQLIAIPHHKNCSRRTLIERKPDQTCKKTGWPEKTASCYKLSQTWMALIKTFPKYQKQKSYLLPLKPPEKERNLWGGEKIMLEIVANNIVTSWPPEHQPTATPMLIPIFSPDRISLAYKRWVL